MRIAIDVSLLFYPQVAGMRLYLDQLLRALLAVGREHEFRLFYHTRRSWRGAEVLEPLVRAGARPVPAPAWVRCVPDSVWWLGYHPPLEWLMSETVDVFHAGDFLWPRSRHTPMVGTVYDLTPELFRELHLWPNRVRHGRQMRWMARHPSRIVAISRATAADFRRLYPVRTPIDVIPPGVVQEHRAGSEQEAARRLRTWRRRLGLTDAPYVLCVGTVEPRKNGERLIRAFEQVVVERGAALPPVHLVFAGRRGWRSGRVYAAAAGSAVAERIHFTGYLDDEDLAALYSDALFVTCPSLYEGFGLPILEAMCAGVPVLTSTISSLPEAAGDAAVLVDPTSVAAIADGLRRLLADERLRRALAEQGRRRAAEFSWEDSARRLLDTYQRAALPEEQSSSGAAARSKLAGTP